MSTIRPPTPKMVPDNGLLSRKDVEEALEAAAEPLGDAELDAGTTVTMVTTVPPLVDSSVCVTEASVADASGEGVMFGASEDEVVDEV